MARDLLGYGPCARRNIISSICGCLSSTMLSKINRLTLIMLNLKSLSLYTIIKDAMNGALEIGKEIWIRSWNLVIFVIVLPPLLLLHMRVVRAHGLKSIKYEREGKWPTPPFEPLTIIPGDDLLVNTVSKEIDLYTRVMLLKLIFPPSVT